MSLLQCLFLLPDEENLGPLRFDQAIRTSGSIGRPASEGKTMKYSARWVKVEKKIFRFSEESAYLCIHPCYRSHLLVGILIIVLVVYSWKSKKLVFCGEVPFSVMEKVKYFDISRKVDPIFCSLSSQKFSWNLVFRRDEHWNTMFIMIFSFLSAEPIGNGFDLCQST